MDLMEFLRALRNTDGTEWSDDDTARWIKELEQAEDYNSPYVEALTKANRKLEGEVLDLRGERDKLKEYLRHCVHIAKLHYGKDFRMAAANYGEILRNAEKASKDQ